MYQKVLQLCTELVILQIHTKEIMAVLFLIAQNWKQPKFPTDGG